MPRGPLLTQALTHAIRQPSVGDWPASALSWGFSGVWEVLQSPRKGQNMEEDWKCKCYRKVEAMEEKTLSEVYGVALWLRSNHHV